MAISANRYLTKAEQQINATELWETMSQQGWTLNSVCGMLGNMQSESTINPGIWQNLEAGNLDGGYGLVQWTPATNYIDWANARGIDITLMSGQIERINWELANNQQWIATSAYPLTFAEFKHSTLAPDYLAQAFLRNYERPKDPDQPWRGTQANEWWEFLSGQPVPSKQRKMPLWFYLKLF